MANGFGETIFSSPLFIEVILPFLLVFTVIFAILQKTKILGEESKQIDAIVGLVVGLIVVSFGYATDIITSLIPVLAISVVVVLAFMLIYGLAFKPGEFELPGGVRGAIGVLAAIVVVVALLIATGGWNYLIEVALYGEGSGVMFSIIFIVIIAVVIFFVVKEPKKKGKDE